MRYEVEPYRTPEGYTDFPFTYVFDGTGLTDGININNLSKPMQGDSDFVLRQVIGADTLVAAPSAGGKIQLYNASKSKMTQSPIIAPKNLTVVPEKIYKYNEEITFDLVNSLRAFNVCAADSTIYTSYLGFRGVKRFHGNPGYRSGLTPYAWREVPQSYTIDVTVNFSKFVPTTATPNPPQRFTVPLDNYDFELFQILISQPGVTAIGGKGSGSAVGLTTNDFGITLYDAQRHQLSDLPQPVLWVSGSKPTAATQQKYQSVVPVPPLVYPAAGEIVFDITSWLCSTGQPQVYNFAFMGVWRVPCVSDINTLTNASQITAGRY